MITLETRVEMSVLHRQGMSIRAIARQLSCSRETVRRYIRSPLPVADIRYKPRAPRPCKVERFNHYLKNSFIVPLTATFWQAGLVLDVPAANARISEWLVTGANTRVHGTTGVAPEQRMVES
ncbi:helix-turn-helix domain-containing protein [Candidatus Erwinia dacicola]